MKDSRDNCLDSNGKRTFCNEHKRRGTCINLNPSDDLNSDEKKYKCLCKEGFTGDMCDKGKLIKSDNKCGSYDVIR